MSELQFTFKDYRLQKLEFRLKEVKQKKGAIDVNQALQCQHKFKGAVAEVFLRIRLDGEQSPFIIEISYLGIFQFNKDLNSVDEKKTGKNYSSKLYSDTFSFY